MFSYQPLTPERLLTGKRFSVQRKSTTINAAKGGSASLSFSEVGSFTGVIGEATASERIRWSQISHPVTHKVVVKGRVPDILDGDAIFLGERKFVVQGIEDPGDLGLWEVLWLEERREI